MIADIYEEWNETEGTINIRTGKCSCGTIVDLYDFTNTCEKCGKEYNSCGQELAERSQWGEETGEHPSECY